MDLDVACHCVICKCKKPSSVKYYLQELFKASGRVDHSIHFLESAIRSTIVCCWDIAHLLPFASWLLASSRYLLQTIGFGGLPWCLLLNYVKCCLVLQIYWNPTAIDQAAWIPQYLLKMIAKKWIKPEQCKNRIKYTNAYEIKTINISGGNGIQWECCRREPEPVRPRNCGTNMLNIIGIHREGTTEMAAPAPKRIYLTP